MNALKALEKNTRPPPSSVGNIWEKQFARTAKGVIKPTLDNVALILSNAEPLVGVIAYNDFAHHIVATCDSPAGPKGRWTDDHDLRLTRWVQASKWKVEASHSLVGTAVQSVAAVQRIHPLRERLNALKWDRVGRIDRWTTAYLGAEDTAVHRAFGTTWMIAAVARAFVPGFKTDTALILEGAQGAGKSTALNILSLGFFSDELADIGSKDAALQVHGAWIIEIAELDALSKAEVGLVKSFLARTTDRFRPPYGRHVVEMPRQCVFAGTVNHGDWLTDETGGRRFLPILVRHVDLPSLRRDVDQLWAEAVARYRAGELSYVPNGELNDDIQLHTSQRFRVDAWHDEAASYVQGRGTITVGQCLDALHVDLGRRTQSDQTRVARILKFLGWERRKYRLGKLTKWHYVEPRDQSQVTEKGDIND